MNSLWGRILFNPGRCSEAVILDDEAPVLIVVPFLAGICMIFAWVGALHAQMTPLTQAGFALLAGPPMILVASWWWRLCLTAVSKLMGEKFASRDLVCIIAWSWLPLLYLSLIAMLFFRFKIHGEWQLFFQAAALIWQLMIIGGVLRKIHSVTLGRTFLLLLFSLLLYLLSLAAAGYGLGTLVNDWFKMASMI